MDWWQAIVAGFRLLTIIKGLRDRGISGEVRTRVEATFPDGTVELFPFLSFRV